MKTFLLLFILTAFSSVLYAQETLTPPPAIKDSTKKHSILKLGMDYYSDNVYLGRKDVDQQSILMPSAGYFHKSGLYVMAGAGYIPQPGYQRFDIKEFEAGYEYSGDKLYASAAYAKYMFNDSSNAINSSISGALQFYADYDFNIATIGAGFDISFTNGTDVILSPVVSHPFYLSNDHLIINPQVQLFAGTQNFYQSYFNPSKGKAHSGVKHGKGHGSSGSAGNGGGGGRTTIVSYNQFKIMDYEISVPLEYTKRNFTITIKPEYILPVNAATLLEDNVITKETLKNSFVMVAGISYKFGHHG